MPKTNRNPEIKEKFKLEKIQRDFLWGGGNLDRKIHLVGWRTVCTNKKGGGLGFRRLEILSKSLLGKWNWRLAAKDNPPWKNLIKLKYGLGSSLAPFGSLLFTSRVLFGTSWFYYSIYCVLSIKKKKKGLEEGVGSRWSQRGVSG